VKAVTQKRVEDLVRVRSSDVDRPVLWIDEATGKIVDHSSAQACRIVVDQVRRAVPVSRPPQEADRVLIDLVGPRPPLTINGCDRVEQTRLPWRLVRQLPARGGGS
jgi:hypothetical protein